ncbi:cysteine proteinase [Serendipita vermifera]|nr:cysteine proteinase [Serendipita vermifera]
MSKALNAEPIPINREDAVDVDIPGSFPVRNSSPLANGGTGIERRQESEEDEEEGDDQDENSTYQREMSEVLTQTHGSSDGSPVPDTPLQSKAGSSSPMRDMSTYGSTFASERSTPLSTSPRKGAMRKPVLKLGFRHHAHPLKKQHELEQRMKHTKELFLLKRARGYSQDLSTFRGYMSYREHLEAFLAATDKKLPPPPSTLGPESIPPLPSTNFLHRAVLNARRTLEGPRPVIPRFSASELLARRNKERDEEIERRLRPKLPDSLPPEDEQKVKQSFANKSFFAKAVREQVTAQDLSRLKPGQWLNDEIINFYGAMISERATKFEEAQSKKQAPGGGTSVNGYNHSPNGKGKSRASNGTEGIGEPWKVHVFNTYFMSKLQEMGYEEARLNKWTKKVDIFSKDLVLIPCNLGNSHWTCAAINFRHKRVEYFDSMGMDRPSIRAALHTYLDKEHRDKKSTPFDFTGWTDFFGEDGPQQENGYDCGVFVCQTMENLSRGISLPFDFSQQDMPYLRRRMVLEITAQELPLQRL